MAAPLIGVTTSEVRLAEEVHRAAEGEPPRPEMALGLTYLKAIERAGDVPVAIPPLGPEPANARLFRSFVKAAQRRDAARLDRVPIPV